MVYANERQPWREELFRAEISARSRMLAPQSRLRPQRCGFKRRFQRSKKRGGPCRDRPSNEKSERLLRRVRRVGHRSLVRADRQRLQRLAKVELAVLLIRVQVIEPLHR